MFGMIPVLLGFVCYYFLGSYVFGDLQVMGKEYLSKHMDTTGWIGNVFFGLITILFAVFMNFTFFIFVSVIAAPFNDLISSRVERIYSKTQDDGQGFSEMMKKLPATIKNELKKVGFIIILSIINVIVSFAFPPASFLLAGLILAISFVDYSWSRNEMTFGECFGDLKKGFLPYLFGGIAFLFLIAIPILNLFFLPLAVVFFTVIYCELRFKNA
jgi:CysZ protein